MVQLYGLFFGLVSDGIELSRYLHESQICLSQDSGNSSNRKRIILIVNNLYESQWIWSFECVIFETMRLYLRMTTITM